MKRYHVPRLAFINKMDRTGANPAARCRASPREDGLRRDAHAVAIGKEDNFEGVIDLVTMKAIYFDGSNGEKVRVEAIPAELLDEATEARQHMLEGLADVQRRADGAAALGRGRAGGIDPQGRADAVQSQDATPVYHGHGL